MLVKVEVAEYGFEQGILLDLAVEGINKSNDISAILNVSDQVLDVFYATSS